MLWPSTLYELWPITANSRNLIRHADRPLSAGTVNPNPVIARFEAAARAPHGSLNALRAGAKRVAVTKMAIEGIGGNGKSLLVGRARLVAQRDLPRWLGLGGATRNERPGTADQSKQDRTSGASFCERASERVESASVHRALLRFIHVDCRCSFNLASGAWLPDGRWSVQFADIFGRRDERDMKIRDVRC